MRLRIFFISVLVALAPAVAAQEVAYIDLTGGAQRIQLRHPPAPPPKCDDQGTCVGGGLGGGSVSCGAEDRRDPRALRVSITWLNSIAYVRTDQLEIEFKLENVGSVPLAIPVSPHLADLQPSDANQKFEYYSLSLVVVGNLTKPLALYGNAQHTGSLLTLNPGEWIRVRGTTAFTMTDAQWDEASERGDKYITATFWLRRVSFVPQPGGYFSHNANLYPRHLPGPEVLVRFLPPPKGETR